MDHCHASPSTSVSASSPTWFVRRQYFEVPKFYTKTKKLERVNLAARLEELGLDQFFDSESWPDATPLRELCTKIKNLTGEGFANPFVFADLRKYALLLSMYIV